MELLEIKKGVNITSNVIAELTGKDHSKVMRDIRYLIESANSESPLLDFQKDIFPTTYRGERREEKNYTLTKDGMMLLITGYSVTHRMKLIKYCGELENKLNAPMTIEDMIISQAESVKALKLDLTEVKGEVKELKHQVDNQITLDSGKQRKLQKAIAIRVIDRCLGIFGDTDEKFKKRKSKFFSAIHRELKNKFGVSSYKDVKTCEFENAINLVSSWVENADIREVV